MLPIRIWKPSDGTAVRLSMPVLGHTTSSVNPRRSVIGTWELPQGDLWNPEKEIWKTKEDQRRFWPDFGSSMGYAEKAYHAELASIDRSAAADRKYFAERQRHSPVPYKKVRHPRNTHQN